MLIFKFVIVISVLEGYFLWSYLQSDAFLVRSLDMIKEAATITNRSFSNYLLFQVLFEMIATNGQGQILN